MSQTMTEAVSGMAKSARETIADTAEKAKDTAQSVGQKAADAVDNTRGATARALTNTASVIHQGVARSSAVTEMADSAADQIDAAARYVKKHDSSQMAADLAQFVRRHPGASIVVAAVFGMIVGRGFRKG